MRANLWMLCAITSLAVATTAEAQPGGGRGGRGGGGFGRGGIFMVVGNEAVQKDLGLSTDAAAKVKTVTDDFGAAIREAMGANGGNFRDLSQEERTKAMEKMAETGKATTEKFLPKLKEVLTPDQFTRLQQINWQVQGTAALSVDSELTKAIPIAQDQQEKIKALTTEYDAKRRELFAGGGGGGGGPEAFQKMQDLNKERDAKITDVLTKDQQDKFASLKGKEFDVAQLRPQGRGPGGGGGGGGGTPDAGGGRPKRPQPKAQ